MLNRWNLAPPSSSRGRLARVAAAFLLGVGALLLVAQSSNAELELLDDEPSDRPALRRAHQALQRLARASRALKRQNYGAARAHLEYSRRVLSEVIAEDADEVLAEGPASAETAGAAPAAAAALSATPGASRRAPEED